MRFIVMGMATKEWETSSVSPKPEDFVAMQEYNEAAVKAGILLAAEGLTPTSQGARVKFSGDKRTVIDGPFAEAKEVVAGFSIIQAKSLAEAIEWVKRAPFGVGVQDGEEPTVEIRPLFDPSDFDPGKGV